MRTLFSNSMGSPGAPADFRRGCTHQRILVSRLCDSSSNCHESSTAIIPESLAATDFYLSKRRDPQRFCRTRANEKSTSNSRNSMRLKVPARLVSVTFRVTRSLRASSEQFDSANYEQLEFFIRGDRDATCHVLRGRKYLRSTRSGTS